MLVDGLHQLTSQTHTDARYSYGWHRAEVLAALVNGVFLLALCFSIFLEAIERFFSTPGNQQSFLCAQHGLSYHRDIKSEASSSGWVPWPRLQYSWTLLIPR